MTTWRNKIKTLDIWKEDPRKQERINEATAIEELELSARSYNGLKRNGCNTVNDLITLIKEEKLERIRGVGQTSINEINEKLKPYMV